MVHTSRTERDGPQRSQRAPRETSMRAARATTLVGLLFIGVLAAGMYWFWNQGDTEPETPARDEVIVPFE